MKKIICLSTLLIITLILMGCFSGGHGTGVTAPSKQEGVITLDYQKPLDFKCFEVHVSKTASFVPTGWNPTYDNGADKPAGAWTSEPNATGDWNGADKTLYSVTADYPVRIYGLSPGIDYHFQVIVVDKTNQRSRPGVEEGGTAGNSQQSATVVIAAADASPASKAGADYVCTGSSDQTIINQAINETVAANPNTPVLIRGTEGNYTVDGSILLPSNVTFDFTGTIKLKDGASGSFNIIKDSGQIEIDKNIIIKNVTVDGNKNNNSSTNCNGISLHVINSLIDSVAIKNVRGNGLNVNFSEISIQNVTAHDNTAQGMCIDGLTNDTGSINVNNCKCYNNGGFGIYLTDCFDDISVVNCASYNNGAGIGVNYSRTIKIANNSVYLNGINGIILEKAYRCMVISNDVYSNSQEANNYYSNIILSASGEGCHDNTIQANKIGTGEQTNKPKYGIRIDGPTCENNLITGNDCVNGGLVAGISDAGTNTNFGSGNRTNDGIWRTSMIIGHDEFDGTGNLVNDLTGKAWTMTGGTWAKTGSGTAYVASASGVTHAYLDTRCGDGSLSWGVSTAANNMRFLFRFTDNSNKWFISADTSGGVYEVYKQVGGTASVVASINVTPAAGDKIKVDLLGDKIVAYINDTQYVELTDSFNKTATKHGVYALATSAARWDYFKMEAV